MLKYSFCNNWYACKLRVYSKFHEFHKKVRFNAKKEDKFLLLLLRNQLKFINLIIVMIVLLCNVTTKP